MATLVLRTGKGSELTYVELDANFTNLNIEVGNKATSATTLAGYGITDGLVLSASAGAALAASASAGVSVTAARSDHAHALPTPAAISAAPQATTYTKVETDAISTALSATLAASGGSALVGYIQGGTGSVLRTLQDKDREAVSVKDFGAVGNGVADDTLAIQSAINSGARVINWPAGKYLITSTIDGSLFQSHWKGTVQGPTFSAPGITEGTTIICRGVNSGNAFVIAPHKMEGFHLDGENSTGTGMAIGREYFFDAFYCIKNITFRRLAVGMVQFNIFNSIFEQIRVESCVKGIKITPLYAAGTNGGDNGYFTTVSWRDIYIRNNSEYGLLVDVPKGCQAWTWENVLIESNGALGTFQASMTNVNLSARGSYFETSSTKTALKLVNCNISIDTGYFNATGGIDLTSNNNTLVFNRVTTNAATDVITGIAGGASVYFDFRNCALRNSVKDLGTNLVAHNTVFNDTATYLANTFRSLQIGKTTTGGEQPANFSQALSYRKTAISGTVPAGGRLEIVTNQYSYQLYGSGYSTHATATLSGGNYYQILPYVSHGNSDDRFSVELFNYSATPLVLSGATLDILFMRSDFITLV